MNKSLTSTFNVKKSLPLNLTALAASVLLISGCTSTYNNNQARGLSSSSNVVNEVVFPDMTTAWQDDGTFPNIESLSKIRKGVSKDNLYNLIGRPHFSEGLRSYEWDYILKFYTTDGDVKTCQYKLLFDNDFLVHSQYWLPADCVDYSVPKVQERIIIQKQPVQIIQQAPPAPQKTQVIRKKLTLDADALFAFDKFDLANMQPSGRIALDEIVSKILQFDKMGDVQLYITGHTDYKGSSEYNYLLSQRRANTVMQYLANRGIPRHMMSATGAGENFPIKQCSQNLPKQMEIDCLKENRRVEIDVVIRGVTQAANQPVKNSKYVPVTPKQTYQVNQTQNQTSGYPIQVQMQQRLEEPMYIQR